MTINYGQSKTITTNSGQIKYWVNRIDDTKPWLVFLPGLTTDHRLFEKQLEYFGKNYNVLVWDAPGHGLSRPFELNFSLMNLAEWLRRIIEIEAIDHPFLVGQSMGGYVAQCYMEHYPDSVAGFVAIDSAPLQKTYYTNLEVWMLAHMEPIFWLYPWKMLRQMSAKNCASTEYGRQLMLEMIGNYDRAEYVKLSGFGYRILSQAIQADLLYQPDCSTLLLFGQFDKAGSVKRYNRLWQKRSGLPLTWVPAAGHNANCDNPEFVNQQIDEFITTILQQDEQES